MSEAVASEIDTLARVIARHYFGIDYVNMTRESRDDVRRMSGAAITSWESRAPTPRNAG